MPTACPSSEVALLTLSWINEQLRQEIARREQLDRRETLQQTVWRRQLLAVLAGGLCGIGLLAVRFCA